MTAEKLWCHIWTQIMKRSSILDRFTSSIHALWKYITDATDYEYSRFHLPSNGWHLCWLRNTDKVPSIVAHSIWQDTPCKPPLHVLRSTHNRNMVTSKLVLSQTLHRRAGVIQGQLPKILAIRPLLLLLLQHSIKITLQWLWTCFWSHFREEVWKYSRL